MLFETFTGILETLNVSRAVIDNWSELLFIGLLILFSLLTYWITKSYLLKKLEVYILNNKFKFDDILLESQVFSRTAQILPAILIYLGATSLPTYSGVIQKVMGLYLIVLTVYITDAVLNAVNSIYRTYEVSKQRPIKSYLQVIKIVVYIFGFIGFAASVMGKSPVYILSGIGAMTAVLMLIFKDSILGLVAGIQLSVNDMVRIGDWIEMPKYNADGDVIDITLNTVKVENFDKTITTIPTYTLISDSFKNWRGMSQSGGRRIKRSLHMDMESIKFCDEKMLKKFERITNLSEYINEKNDEITKYNSALDADDLIQVNGRNLTNIGVFRAYVQHYLKNHPKVHKHMTVMARQLAPTEKGIAIEVYCFTNDTNWANYEGVQADIFDHLIAILSTFELRVYQSPSGYDMQKMGCN
ncbi:MULTISPECIES: mechanosensitive ion channel family protein [unclassified Fusibacter]|uniref:mechanosensitive ion channel family protein n=1 Tax=unclassified Fusibacter TaxID=2624464 RepID=UPI001FAAAE41|nr:MULTISPECIES: mechanosensitive ion channel domain-containing protein [unclassified Fusibacter]MCK8060745.1 mechanosensitive ion channel family protein [Fusibacter sp. A2]